MTTEYSQRLSFSSSSPEALNIVVLALNPVDEITWRVKLETW